MRVSCIEPYGDVQGAPARTLHGWRHIGYGEAHGSVGVAVYIRARPFFVGESALFYFRAISEARTKRFVSITACFALLLMYFSLALDTTMRKDRSARSRQNKAACAVERFAMTCYEHVGHA
mmetsp:Transcript_34048/g.65619  ORF Transcript_34048/g.65619 Transcript_34048/m.65619 type:complete len:121 (-) Transcript_34048:197-559(-)